MQLNMDWDPNRPGPPPTPSSLSSGNSGGSSSRVEKTPNFKQFSPSPTVAALSKTPEEELCRKGTHELVQLVRRVEVDYKSLLAEHGNVVKDVNRRLQIFVLETRELKENLRKLQDDNQELRDLCCFLDDDRQRGRKLAREWQRFGRYTASVMRSEVAVYQDKLKELEDRQSELVAENMDLKELCLYLDQERLRSPSDHRDEGDGSSNGTVAGLEDNAALPVSSVTGALETTSGSITPVPFPVGNTASSTASYIKELEMKIQHLEEEKRNMKTSKDTVSSPSRTADDQWAKDMASKSGAARKPEAVVHAMKVLEVHEELEKTPTEEDLEPPEKAIVREMCNVVWRKLGDVGDVGNLDESLESIGETPYMPQLSRGGAASSPQVQQVSSSGGSGGGPASPSHSAYNQPGKVHSYSLSQPQPQMASTPLAAVLPAAGPPADVNNLDQRSFSSGHSGARQFQGHPEARQMPRQQESENLHPTPGPAGYHHPQHVQQMHSPSFYGPNADAGFSKASTGLPRAGQFYSSSDSRNYSSRQMPGPQSSDIAGSSYYQQFSQPSYTQMQQQQQQPRSLPPMGGYPINEVLAKSSPPSREGQVVARAHSPTKQFSDRSHFSTHHAHQKQPPPFVPSVPAAPGYRPGASVNQRSATPEALQKPSHPQQHRAQSSQSQNINIQPSTQGTRDPASHQSGMPIFTQYHQQQHQHQPYPQARAMPHQQNHPVSGPSQPQSASAVVRLLGAPGQRDDSRDTGKAQGVAPSAPGGPPQHPQGQRNTRKVLESGPALLNQPRGLTADSVYDTRDGLPSGRDPPHPNNQVKLQQAENKQPQAFPSNPQQQQHSQAGIWAPGFRAYPPHQAQGPTSYKSALPSNPVWSAATSVRPHGPFAAAAQGKGHRYQEQEWRQTYLDDSDTL